MDNMDKVMDVLEDVKTGFAQCKDFTSRSGRRTFWSFIIFVVLVSLFTSSLDGLIFGYDRVVSPLNILSSLVLIVPTLAVTTRRLHDINKSGYWQVLPVITLLICIGLGVFTKMSPDMDLGLFHSVSVMAMLISFALLMGFCAIGGDPTVNQFGAVPEVKEDKKASTPATYIYRSH